MQRNYDKSAAAPGPENTTLSQKIAHLSSLFHQQDTYSHLLNAILDYTPAIIIIKDQDGRIMLSSRQHADLFNTTPEALIGKTSYDLFRHDIADARWQIEKRVIETGTSDIVEEPLPLADGMHTLLVFKFPIFNNDQVPIGVGIIATDITERKRVEEKLRKLERAVEQSTVSVIITDKKGTIEYVNPMFTRVTGYTFEEVQGQNPRILKSGEMPPEAYRQLWDTITSGRDWHGEFHNRKKNGECYWESATISPITDSEGNITHFVAVKEDITERKRIEHALHQSHETLEQRINERTIALQQANADVQRSEVRYREITELISDSVYSVHVNPDGTFAPEWGFNGIEALTGYTPEAFVQQWAQLVHPDDAARYNHYLNQLRKGWPVMREYRIITKDGRTRWIQDHSRPVKDECNGCLLRFYGAIKDTTIHRYTAEALRESERRLATIMDNLPGMAYRCHNHPLWTMVFVSEGCQRLTGYAPADLIDNATIAYNSIIHPQDRQAVWDTIQQSIKEHRPFTCKYRICTASGEEKWVWEQGVSIATEHDTTVMLEGFITDITETVRAEEQIRQHAAVSARLLEEVQQERALLSHRVEERTAELSRINDELARAVRTKDDFLSNMSHELRTPLNAILGMSESLQAHIYGPLNERQKKSINAIQCAGQHLLSLINDILDISKIEAGKVEMYLGPVSVEHICLASIQFIKQQALKKHIEVSCTIQNEQVAMHYDEQKLYEYANMPHITMYADERRLKQILINLLSNAVKFTPAHGSIGLDVHVHTTDNTIHFVVWDTGIGITPENQQRLFQPFVQVDSGLSRQYEGTGLGLALVRSLARLHGGSVSLVSDVGKGSRFTVSLPLSQDNSPP